MRSARTSGQRSSRRNCGASGEGGKLYIRHLYYTPSVSMLEGLPMHYHSILLCPYYASLTRLDKCFPLASGCEREIRLGQLVRSRRGLHRASPPFSPSISTSIQRTPFQSAAMPAPDAVPHGGPSPSPRASWLDRLGRRTSLTLPQSGTVLRVLTSTQNCSALVFSIFLGVHLASPILASVGGITAADNTLVSFPRQMAVHR